ncbi:MAG: hypothetical protein H5T73_08650 [Actinobacteria bacterium]|nr:hypothetical protein [Actinomycetota bacterium]
MGKKGVRASALFLLCAALSIFLLAGCGSASDDSYEREIHELSERLSGKLQDVVAGIAREDHAEEGERAAEAWSQMADLLEEGARELSHVRVPAGREELQSSLLELLRNLSGACREAADALLPASGEHGEEAASAHGEESDGENAGEGAAEHEGETEADHGAAPETETQVPPQESHGH